MIGGGHIFCHENLIYLAVFLIFRCVIRIPIVLAKRSVEWLIGITECDDHLEPANCRSLAGTTRMPPDRSESFALGRAATPSARSAWPDSVGISQATAHKLVRTAEMNSSNVAKQPTNGSKLPGLLTVPYIVRALVLIVQGLNCAKVPAIIESGRRYVLGAIPLHVELLDRHIEGARARPS